MKSLNMMRWLIMQDKCRYDYPLNENSIVFDIGGYGGETSFQLNELYHPKIYVFEPVRKYYESLRNRFLNDGNISVFPYGLGAYSRDSVFQVNNGSSTLFEQRMEVTDYVGQHEIIKIKSITDFIREQKINKIDLMCINIEGMEYELIDELIRTGDIEKVENIQIQFHRTVEDYKWKRIRIITSLKNTHKRTYNFPYIMENWKKC